MKYEALLIRIANNYYNLGLERAKLRDLSGAVEYLKTSLRYNKRQTDARNLLGLIFFECGETADALVQWVISLNFQPQNNRADYYLDEIQRKPAILKICSENVKKYNSALYNAQNGSDDLAILQLSKVIEDSPHFIKAHILLSLLNMKRENYVKAGKSLMTVLKIDRNNPKAVFLMDEVKRCTGKAEIEQNRMKNAFSHRKMEDDDVLIPVEQKGASPLQVILYLLVGLVIGVAAFYLLVLPAHVKALNSKNNQEIVSNMQQLDAKNQEYDSLKSQYDAVYQQNQEAQAQLAAIQNENIAYQEQYQTLTQIKTDYQSGNITEAAQLYTTFDQSAVTDEGISAMLAEIKSYMESTGWKTLTQLGTDSWNAGNKTAAQSYYALSMEINPNDPETMFLLARLYQTMDNTTEANQIFDKLVGEHPDSEYADKAREARGY